MNSIKIVNEEIKELESTRYKTIQKFTALVDPDKINYDLHSDRVISKLEKYLKTIDSLWTELQALYRVKDKLERNDVK